MSCSLGDYHPGLLWAEFGKGSLVPGDVLMTSEIMAFPLVPIGPGRCDANLVQMPSQHVILSDVTSLLVSCSPLPQLLEDLHQTRMAKSFGLHHWTSLQMKIFLLCL